jgi:GH15 family glucan-1,4-alpha-glucosidase
MREPRRIDGYAPIGDYGVIGNERTAALVALDGSIDYLCLPRFDSAACFSALLDSRRGGRFELAPTVPFRANRRYLPGTNVLETTFETAAGKARVIDAMSIPLTGPMAWEEVVRKVEGLAGKVPMRWHVAPRFGWGARAGESIARAGGTAIRDGDTSLLVRSWDAGERECRDGEAWAEFETAEGSSGLIVLASHPRQPWLLDDRDAHERRLEDTCEYWRRWLQGCRCEGPWREAVERSALALAMLVHSPSGAMMAAATTSLPEAIGGSRNFDYRYCWLRDTAFVLEAMLQLGNYGDLLQAVRKFVEDGNSVGPGAARMLGGTLDFLPRVWRNPDSSIWELPDRRQYLQGKLAAWMAFDCGLRLHERGEVEGSPGSWRAERDEVERFIEERCWSDERGAYVFHADTRGLDASSLLMARTRYLDGHEERFAATVRAVREELGAGGALLHRYSGMRSEEGAFVACSFWLIEALARLGRRDEAAELMDDMVGRGNDLGLFSEEIDPEGGELLGNVPQALSHLALVNAAFALEAS